MFGGVEACMHILLLSFLCLVGHADEVGIFVVKMVI